MKPRSLAVLIIVVNQVFTSVSKAQMWGTGMWGGMQSCPYGYGAANGASDVQDEINDELEEIRELKHNRREDQRRQRELEKRKQKYLDAINGSFNSGWAGVIIDHIEGGFSCCNQPPPAVGYPTSNPPVYDSPNDDYVPLPQPPVRPPPPPPQGPGGGKPPNKLSDIFEPAKSGGRAPANVGGPAPAAQAPQAAQVADDIEATGGPLVGGAGGANGGVSPWDADLPDGNGFPGEGGGPNCAPPNALNQTRRWKQFYCREGGEVSRGICRDARMTTPEARRGAECDRAIAEYRKIYNELMALTRKIASYDDEIQARQDRIRELRRDMREESREGRLEAGCRECERHSRRAERGPSLTSMALPLIGGLLGAAGSMYLGYQANKQGNQINGRLGWPAQPYNAFGYGYPFMAMGIQGAVAAGTNGGFGCAPGMYGGGPFGPYGMGSPFGYGLGPYGMMNGPFGYPNMFGMNPMMGGGMYAPGMGPWGMSGPWGNGYNPMFGMGAGMGMGMPGVGLGGGIGLGMGGYPGMGMGMGYPGMGMGMGMPGIGFGLGGGLGMGMPMAGMGAMGYPMYPGAGLGGGVGAGIGMGMPYAGYGLTPGFGMGGMGYPGYGGGYGMPGYGMGVGMGGSPYMMAAMSQYRAQMGLNQEYNSLVYRMNQLNNGMLGAGLGGGAGAYGGYGLYQPYGVGYGLGAGINAGFGVGGGLGVYGGGYGLGAPGTTR